MLCHNHGYLVKDTLEECDLIKCYFIGDYKMTGTDASSGPADNKEKGDAYPDPRGCLMIFGGSMAYKSKHRQKLMAREFKHGCPSRSHPGLPEMVENHDHFR